MEDRRPLYVLATAGSILTPTQPGAGPAMSRTALWIEWARIAVVQTAQAEAARSPDEVIDWFADALHGVDTPKPEAMHDDSDWREVHASLVAIAAAAFALDGFYGAVKPLVTAPVCESRHSSVAETLKVAFKTGRRTSKITDGVRWLFDLRDGAVHHSDAPRELVEHRRTDRTIVYGAPEALDYSASVAREATGFALETLRWCLGNPKPGTQEFADTWREAVDKLD